MRPDKTLFALIMLGALASCYPPTQSSYSPTISEQPQPLHPSYEMGVGSKRPSSASDATALHRL